MYWSDKVLSDCSVSVSGRNLPTCIYLLVQHSHGIYGEFKPQCLASGDFDPQQCHEATCWCVDKYGRKIEKTETLTPSKLNCKGMFAHLGLQYEHSLIVMMLMILIYRPCLLECLYQVQRSGNMFKGQGHKSYLEIIYFLIFNVGQHLIKLELFILIFDLILYYLQVNIILSNLDNSNGSVLS